MSGPVLVLVVAAAVLALVGAMRQRKLGRRRESGTWPVFPKKLLSPVEQHLYQRLIRAFPNHVVLSQVAVSQLVGVKKGNDFGKIYNRFNRLVADFVLCNRDFSVAAVFELDDRSHDHPKRHDADQRKAGVLQAAGIALHRLNVNPLPDESDLRALVVSEFPPIRAIRG